MFLYILQFEKEDLIKIGISESNNRITCHMNTYSDYGIDLGNSYKITAKSSRDIKLLERQLLIDYSDSFITNETLNGRDGYTEIRNGSILKFVIEDIEYKMRRLENKKFKIKKGIKINANKPIANKSKTLDETRYRDRNKKQHSEYIALLNKHSSKMIDVTNVDDGIHFEFEHLLDVELDELCWGNDMVFASDNEEIEGYSIFKCSDSSTHNVVNPTNKLTVKLKLHYDKNFTQLREFRDDVLYFIKNKREVWRYMSILEKYIHKVKSVAENDSGLDINFSNLNKLEYQEIRENCFIGFQRSNGFVNCGGGLGRTHESEFTMMVKLNHAKDWVEVNTFESDLLSFIDKFNNKAKLKHVS